jgi:DNA-binding MarR family transcriptional regulator
MSIKIEEAQEIVGPKSDIFNDSAILVQTVSVGTKTETAKYSSCIYKEVHYLRQLLAHQFETKSNGITAVQFIIMDTINALTEPCQKDIVENTGIDRSTITDVLRRLQKLGLITRTRTVHDERKYIVKLTNDGEFYYNNNKEVMQEVENDIKAIARVQRVNIEFLQFVNQSYKSSLNGEKVKTDTC